MNNKRREFLKVVGGAALTLPVLGKLGQVAFAQELKDVAADDPMATALGYSSDATKVDTAKFPKRAGAEGAKQFCKNCMLYVQGGLAIPGKQGEYGKCSVMTNGLVSANGWCNSWVQKPGA